MSCDNPKNILQNPTPAKIKTIKVSELDQFTKVSNPIFLDVRTPEEFAIGSIPNSTHINYYDDHFKAKIQKLDKTSPYIVYCKSGFRSQKVSKLMLSFGFTNVYNLTGGYDAWKE